MDYAPWIWVPLWGLIAIAFWGFLLWLAWSLVAAVKDIREELRWIREILGSQSRGPESRSS